MTTKENQSQRKIYLRSLKRWVSASEEVFREYYAMTSNYRRKQQRHGRCVCPKHKRQLCDMDCAVCEYRRAGDLLSLDAEVETNGQVHTVADRLTDKTVSAEEIAVENDIFEALHCVLQALPPKERRMCRLYMEGKSGRESATIMHIHPSTYNRRWNKLLLDLFEKLKWYI